MWLTGFGAAFETCSVNDVFWQIPGDFEYDTPAGESALKSMLDIPDKVYEGKCELCLGEIEVHPNDPKHLIDTYGTYGLLYNWFPVEAQAIRRITGKPRSEFFAISHDYLKAALMPPERWFPYEQTIVLLLQGLEGAKEVRKMDTVKLGKIVDDPSDRSQLSGPMQQIERTERVLKLYWREQNKGNGNWPDMFRKLDAQSEQVRGAALIIMQQLLGLP